MKSFSPTWQQVVLLLGLIAAVVLTHMFAVPAVGAVTSIVSTIVGALFVNLRRNEQQADDKGRAS
jgi:uncharacterized membrane protein YdcZ (DUF606 family)